MIYLAAGVDKAMGNQWWNCEAIWQTVSQPIFSTFDLSWLARHSWIPMLAGWGTLVVEIGYTFLVWPRRTRKLWCITAIGFHLGTCLFMGLVFFSSLMILLTSCLFLIPEEVTERAVAPRRALAQAAVVVAMCMLSIGLAARGVTGRGETAGLPPDFARLVRRVMARDQIPGVAVELVDSGRLCLRARFRLPRCGRAPTGHARHALPSWVLLEGVHRNGDRAACGRGKDRARCSGTHVPPRFFSRRPGGVGDADNAGSSHSPQWATPA